jgi:hypothetical protein
MENSNIQKSKLDNGTGITSFILSIISVLILLISLFVPYNDKSIFLLIMPLSIAASFSFVSFALGISSLKCKMKPFSISGIVISLLSSLIILLFFTPMYIFIWFLYALGIS